MHEAPKCEQRLVRRDVRGRLLASDVLLTGLQGQDIAALPRGVERLADDPARRSSSGSDTPPRWGTSTISSPKPGAYVLTTCRTCGLVASVTTTFLRPVACFAT